MCQIYLSIVYLMEIYLSIVYFITLVLNTKTNVMNILMQMFFCTYVFFHVEYAKRYKIALPKDMLKFIVSAPASSSFSKRLCRYALLASFYGLQFPSTWPKLCIFCLFVLVHLVHVFPVQSNTFLGFPYPVHLGL